MEEMLSIGLCRPFDDGHVRGQSQGIRLQDHA